MVETDLATCAFLSYSQIPWNDKGVQNETHLFYLKKNEVSQIADCSCYRYDTGVDTCLCRYALSNRKFIINGYVPISISRCRVNYQSFTRARVAVLSRLSNTCVRYFYIALRRKTG